MSHPKLRDDTIVEALCDIRFIDDNGLPDELLIGRLIDRSPWKDWKARRLPSSDIPAQIRRSEEQLRFQPTVELSNPSGDRTAKVGSNVLSLHFTGRYPGWDAVWPEIESLIDTLKECVPRAIFERVGLRYINAFDKERHFVQKVYDLDFGIKLDQQELDAPINLNFVIKPSETHHVMTRLASPDFVNGNLEPTVTAVADIDVFNPTKPLLISFDAVKDWFRVAHDVKNDAYFALVPDSLVHQLTRGQ